MGVFVQNQPSADTDNTIQPTADNVTPLTLRGHSAGQTAPLLVAELAAGTADVLSVLPTAEVIMGDPNVGPSIDCNPAARKIQVNGQTIDGFNAGLAALTATFVNDGVATYTSRFLLRAFHHGGGAPTIVAGESNGSAGMVGFLGATPVVRQTGASAAGIAAITDPNAKAAIQALQTALANLGLVTSPA